MNVSPANPKEYLIRSQQGVILLLGIILMGLLLGRSGLVGGEAASSASSGKIYWVEIGGAVARPGVYDFPQPPEIQQLWAVGGGPGLPPALSQPLASGSRIMVAKDGSYTLDRMSGAKLLVLGLAIDLNNANARDLEAIPGIGPVLAARIIQYRETNGPFNQIEELSKVNGIGPKNLEEIRPHLTILANQPGNGQNTENHQGKK
ncbi:MAG: helix-hairpin-helix domain-containing protein [Deltaproteobacteria bacterium]|nr:helix-hairpin-helix domain-containing protein [Deltaproteobacteria bacterium]MBW2135481.1 helix-hairpin-helix domain-containing protein [Deltaproteobacteria bacterium]